MRRDIAVTPDGMWLGSTGVGHPVDRAPSPVENIPDFAAIRANLLQLLNEEREVARQPALAIDDLAAKVATAHASDMATGEFVSHDFRVKSMPPT